MLVFTRRVGEEIVVGGDIRIVVLSVHGNRVRLGVTAPQSVRVDRYEVHNRRVQSPSDQTRSLMKALEGKACRTQGVV